MADLASFAKESPAATRGVPCWVCSIPEVAEINAAKTTGAATVTQMIAWLIEDRGYADTEARRPRLSNHFQSKHHELWPNGRT